MLYIVMVMTLKTIYSCNLGRIEYRKALDIQTRLHEKCVNGSLGGAILCLEHPSVLTMGKSASSEHLLRSKEDLEALGIEVVNTDRGGEVTAHEPGQLVLYGILPLAKLGLSPKKYVCLLEGIIIDFLAELGVEANRDAEHPGVWVNGAKVAAIGIRIKNRVSFHGIALNIDNSLKTFEYIVPCGIKGRSVTNLKRLLGGAPVSLEEVAAGLLLRLSRVIDTFEQMDSSRLNQLIL